MPEEFSWEKVTDSPGQEPDAEDVQATDGADVGSDSELDDILGQLTSALALFALHLVDVVLDPPKRLLEFEEGASAGCTGFARCGYWFTDHGLSMLGRLFGHPGRPHPAPNGGHADK